MDSTPIITIHSTTEDWSNLGATTHGIIEGDTIQVPVQLGRMEYSILRMDVEEITEDTIRFRAGGYNRELHKGGQSVCVTYTIGGYTDHEGCDWDGTDYDYWISWK